MYILTDLLEGKREERGERQIRNSTLRQLESLMKVSTVDQHNSTCLDFDTLDTLSRHALLHHHHHYLHVIAAYLSSCTRFALLHASTQIRSAEVHHHNHFKRLTPRTRLTRFLSRSLFTPPTFIHTPLPVLSFFSFALVVTLSLNCS